MRYLAIYILLKINGKVFMPGFLALSMICIILFFICIVSPLSFDIFFVFLKLLGILIVAQIPIHFLGLYSIKLKYDILKKKKANICLYLRSVSNSTFAKTIVGSAQPKHSVGTIPLERESIIYSINRTARSMDAVVIGFKENENEIAFQASMCLDRVLILNDKSSSWLTTVKSCLYECSVVIAVPDESLGIMSELSIIVKEGYLEKVVIIIPPPDIIPDKGYDYNRQKERNALFKSLKKRLPEIGINIHNFKYGCLYHFRNGTWQEVKYVDEYDEIDNESLIKVFQKFSKGKHFCDSFIHHLIKHDIIDIEKV